jgi:DNA-binding transcriptional MocR family regulator
MRSSLLKMDPWRSVDDLGGGNEVLRQQIALRYMVHGIHIPVDEIVITNGALEALNLCLMAVTRPGDAVVVESPTFYGALQSLEQRGLRAVEVATHPGEGLDLHALAEALDRYKPKACWLMTNFQNPLGCLMPDHKKRDLVELLARHDTPLIEDDVYGELYFGSSAPRPAKGFDTHGIVMHCSSFSKSLAPGYRIGWAAPGRYAQTVSRLKTTSSLSASAPAQAAIAEYLKKGSFDRHLVRLRHAMASQLHSMLEAIRASFPAGTRATRPTGGYFLWVEIPAAIDVLQIHRLACEMGISVAPGPMFSSQGQFANCLRINYGHPWNQRNQRAMAELGRLVRAHCGG